MQPINSQPLISYGESFKRLGNTKRKESYDKLKFIEEAILANKWLPASADVTPIQPPYFTEFTYTDILGGMLLRSFSAEINSRITPVPDSIDEIDPTLIKQFLDILGDKYVVKPAYKHHKKIVFLPGHNIFDRIVDSQKLFEIMDSDEHIMIKPHPITNDILLRNLGNQFGYSRIIDKDISGYNLVLNCNEVYSVSTSELPIVAMLNDIKFTDITQYMNSWSGSLSALINNAKKRSKPRDYILKSLLSDESGFMLPFMSPTEIENRINKYCVKALKAREVFKMTTSQRLTVQTPQVIPPGPPKESNEVQQTRPK